MASHNKLLTTALFALLATNPQLAQIADTPQPSTISLDGTRKSDPVSTVDFLIRGKEGWQRVAPAKPFVPKDPLWIPHTTLEIQNVSGKTIVGIWASLFFPEADNGISQVATQVHVGARPPQAQYNKDGEHLLPNADVPLALKTEDTWQIPLGTEYKNIKSLLDERRQLPYTQMKVEFNTVYFSDGTKWSPGYYGKPDPNRLGKYIEITPNDFYASAP